MNKKIFLSLFMLIAIPLTGFAQQGDVDPQGDSSCVSIVNNLRYRTTDAKTDGEVSVLQDFLQTNGYLQSNPVGFFGLMTTAAVKKFQKANSISPTGYVGPITREKIKIQSCSNQTSVNTGDTTGQGQSTAGVTTSTTTSSGQNISAPTAAFTRSLDVGYSGADVTSLQQFLSARGFLSMPAGVAMGYFDQTTKNALSSYQNAAGIYPGDGYFGPATRASVDAAMSITPTITPGMTTDQLRQAFNTAVANGGKAVSTVPGCSVGLVFSPTTGQACFNAYLPTNSTAASNSGYTLTSNIDSRSTAFDTVTFTARFDSNKIEPVSLELGLSCPAGVSTNMVGQSRNACGNVTSMIASGNGIYKLTLNFTNTTTASQPIKATLSANNQDRDMAYNTFVLQSTAMLAIPDPSSPQTPSVPFTVTSPNSGTYSIGTPLQITWSGEYFDNGVTISLSGFNPNTGVGMIGQVLNGQNSFSWDGKTYCNTFSNGAGSDCGVVPAGTHRIILVGTSKTGKYNHTEGSNFTLTGSALPITPPATVTTPVSTNTNTTCPQSLTINGTTYTISPCSINLSMTDGQGDKNFSTTITATGANTSFGYSTRGYGVGFPTYGILGGGSGGASGNTTLNLRFSDANLSANGTQSKIYTGYLPIHIFQGSETGNDNNFLNLNVNTTVNPAN
jgi:peptidoglycan hydrolase-like protein with peptidoglycan-binding domain